jgi:hypothetical protein
VARFLHSPLEVRGARGTRSVQANVVGIRLQLLNKLSELLLHRNFGRSGATVLTVIIGIVSMVPF